jgi:copper oxidase (laccase) domain-containing protein
MTQNEREELIFDLAQARVKRLSDAGIFAMAVDQMCSLLSSETDEQLLKVSLGYLPKKDKKESGKGF